MGASAKKAFSSIGCAAFNAAFAARFFTSGFGREVQEGRSIEIIIKVLKKISNMDLLVLLNDLINQFNSITPMISTLNYL